MKNHSYFLGIDFSEKYAMVSFYQNGMAEPETVSPIAGSEQYQIPLVAAKRSDQEEWVYGEEARYLAKNNEAHCVEALYSRALAGEEIITKDQTCRAELLLAGFIRKLMSLPMMLRSPGECARLGITVGKVTERAQEMFYEILPRLGLDEERFYLMDHKSAFCYFALNQPSQQWNHEVFLFECSGHFMRYMELTRNTRLRPQLITITESRRYALSEMMDRDFSMLLKEAFQGKSVSASYLTGDGFEGDWMKQSLSILCRGRRAFIGRNLFSKGACYGAWVSLSPENWPFLYIGETDMKFHLSLRINDRKTRGYHTLISAGSRWYHTQETCEVILSSGSELEVWKHIPDAKEADFESIELLDLPERPERTTRLRITARPVSDSRVDLEITDLGFGEFFRSTEKSWHYTITG